MAPERLDQGIKGACGLIEGGECGIKIEGWTAPRGGNKSAEDRRLSRQLTIELLQNRHLWCFGKWKCLAEMGKPAQYRNGAGARRTGKPAEPGRRFAAKI